MFKLPGVGAARLLGLAGLLAVTLLGVAGLSDDAHAKGKKPAAKKSGDDAKGSAKKEDSKKDAKKDAKKEEADEAKSEDAAPAEGKEGPGPKKEEIRTTGPAKLKRPTSERGFENSVAADAKRDEQIKAINEIIGQQNDPATKAELVFRLAELYWDKSRFIMAGEYAEYEKIIEKWQQNGSKGAEPVPSHKKSEVYKKQALANYSIILEKYPDYPRRDEVLYIMASNTYEAGKKDKAIAHYWELIKQYPNSEYVGDAYLAMGEHYFNSNDVIKAQKALKKALETKKPKIYSYALYKLAWCDFNLQEWDAAITKFKKVVKYSNEQMAKSGKDKDNVQLKSEALNDITLTYSHVEAVDTAYDYLKTEGGPEKARKLTNKLAGFYMDQGKYETAIQTFRLLINYYPDDPDCPDFQSSIVSAFFKLNKRDEIRVEVKRLVELYRPGTPWWKKNEKNPKNTAKALEIAEERMRELVTDTHQIYTKLKKQEDAELARDMYSDYLKVFPETEHSYRLRFFYAEILWDLGEWPNAATQYDLTVENDKANKFKGEYTRQAAYNAILAYEKIAKGEKKGEFKHAAKDTKGAKASGKDVKRKDENVGSTTTIKTIKDKKAKLEKEEIPEAEVKLAAACDKYVTVIPVNEKISKELTDELVLVKFKAGAIYQNHFHFEEAARRFEELIDRWPNHEFARKGADLVLDSWDFRENWTELNRVGRKFQKNKNLMGDKDFSSRVDKFVEGSSFKEILVINDHGKKLKDEHKDDEAATVWADAATRFMEFQKEFPSSQFADKAVFNAVIIYDNADKLDLAETAAQLLVKDYAKSDQVKPTIYMLAQFHERLAEFRDAAGYYEQYVGKYPKEKEAPDALYNAALFYQGLGDRKKAVELYGKYLKDYKDQSDVADVYWKIARIYDEDGDLKRAGTLYSEFEKTYPKAPAPRIIESRYNFMMTMMGDKKREGDIKAQCEDILKRTSKFPAELKKDTVVMRAAAHCSFMALEPKFTEYTGIKLELPMSKLKKNLEAKANKLDAMKNDYTAVLSIGDGAWGVAALYRVAVIHHDFAKALKDSPDPPGLNPDQLEIYRSELEGQTFPVDEKAIQALEAALAKAFELGIYTEWTARAQDLLKEYKPNEFPAVHSMPFYYSDFFSAGTAASKGGN